MNEIQLLNEFKQYIHSTDQFPDINRIRFKFPNGFGASVIRGMGTYGADEGLFELGVLTFTEDDDWELHYDNPVANGDVVGYLTAENVFNNLVEIMNFPSERKLIDD